MLQYFTIEKFIIFCQNCLRYNLVVIKHIFIHGNTYDISNKISVIYIFYLVTTLAQD